MRAEASRGFCEGAEPGAASTYVYERVPPRRDLVTCAHTKNCRACSSLFPLRPPRERLAETNEGGLRALCEESKDGVCFVYQNKTTSRAVYRCPSIPDGHSGILRVTTSKISVTETNGHKNMGQAQCACPINFCSPREESKTNTKYPFSSPY